MRFLVDADVPRRTVELIRSFGHDATDVRDIGLSAADDVCIAAYAQRHSLCLISGDFGFADIRNYPPADHAGLVVLGLPRDATAKFILHLMESLLSAGSVGVISRSSWSSACIRDS